MARGIRRRITQPISLELCPPPETFRAETLFRRTGSEAVGPYAGKVTVGLSSWHYSGTSSKEMRGGEKPGTFCLLVMQ